MNALLFYLLKVVLCSGLLYGYYWLALRNNRFHQWNRYYLLSATFISLVAPLLRLPFLDKWSGSTTVMRTYTAEVVSINAHYLTPADTASSTPNNSFLLAYAGIAIALLILSAIAVFKIIRLASKNPKKPFNQLFIVFLQSKISPFSFFRYIFWNKELDPESVEGRQIFRHELVHVNERHSLDKLFMEIICALYWINPFFHLMRRELSLIHEFIADKKAAENEDYQQYAENMLQQALLLTPYSITNNFFHAQIKRRITMLISSRKNRYAYLRRIMTIPIAIAVCYTIAIGKDRADQFKTLNKQDHIASLASDTSVSPPIYVIGYRSSNTIPQAEKIFSQVEQPPQFRGGQPQLLKYLHNNIRYPAEARDSGVGGNVMVSFVVRKDGEISHVTTLGKRHGHGLEEEAMRVVENMPRWQAGVQNGKKVNVAYKLPIHFELQGETAKTDTVPPAPPPAQVYKFVEQPPTYPGGEEALLKYLHDHIHYPKVARDNGIQGTVTVTFVVTKKGELQGVKLLGKPKGGGLDEEAVRVVKAMPKWRPGKQDGKPVNVQFNLPVRFQLQ